MCLIYLSLSSQPASKPIAQLSHHHNSQPSADELRTVLWWVGNNRNQCRNWNDNCYRLLLRLNFGLCPFAIQCLLFLWISFIFSSGSPQFTTGSTLTTEWLRRKCLLLIRLLLFIPNEGKLYRKWESSQIKSTITFHPIFFFLSPNINQWHGRHFIAEHGGMGGEAKSWL